MSTGGGGFNPTDTSRFRSMGVPRGGMPNMRSTDSPQMDEPYVGGSLPLLNPLGRGPSPRPFTPGDPNWRPTGGNPLERPRPNPIGRPNQPRPFTPGDPNWRPTGGNPLERPRPNPIGRPNQPSPSNPNPLGRPMMSTDYTQTQPEGSDSTENLLFNPMYWRR